MHTHRPFVLTGPEACQILGISEGELIKLLNRALIKGFQVGDDIRIGLKSLEEYLGLQVAGAQLKRQRPKLRRVLQ